MDMDIDVDLNLNVNNTRSPVAAASRWRQINAAEPCLQAIGDEISCAR